MLDACELLNKVWMKNTKYCSPTCIRNCWTKSLLLNDIPLHQNTHHDTTNNDDDTTHRDNTTDTTTETTSTHIHELVDCMARGFTLHQTDTNLHDGDENGGPNPFYTEINTREELQEMASTWVGLEDDPLMRKLEEEEAYGVAVEEMENAETTMVYSDDEEGCVDVLDPVEFMGDWERESDEQAGLEEEKEMAIHLDKVGKFVTTHPTASSELKNLYYGLKRKIKLEALTVGPRIRKQKSLSCYFKKTT